MYQLYLSAKRNTGDSTPSVSVANNGSKIYIVYPIEITEKEKIAAEVIRINKQLDIKFPIYGDSHFNVVHSGYANPEFTRFSLISSNIKGSAQLKVYDALGNVYGSSEIRDYYGAAIGGQWLDTHLVLSYLTSEDHSFIRIYNDRAKLEVSGYLSRESFLTLLGFR